MDPDEYFMKRCLELAEKGLGSVAPNPMVGAVIVSDGKIIGEGFHEKFGEAHAEVNAINSVHDHELLKRCTLYVSLEPCSHTGKTPPCTDLIIEKRIPKLVIGCRDEHPLVNGRGIKRLLDAGIFAEVGTLEEECLEMNRRFFTSVLSEQPYVILKWAQTADGFIDHTRIPGDGKPPLRISSEESIELSHQWRSEEQAIMVGTGTALMDDPLLTVRARKGRNPLRILIDRELKVPAHAKIFSKDAQTLVFSEKSAENTMNVDHFKVKMDSFNEMYYPIARELNERGIRSLIVEGGAKLIRSFINANAWHEARVIISSSKIGTGLAAPVLGRKALSRSKVGVDDLFIFRNR